MAKKNKEPIIGIGKDPDNKLVVQKARPLTALAGSNLSLAEFKILDAYLARINTRDPEHRTVRLTKGQLENALGVTRINKPDLEQRLRNLYQPIDLAKDDKKRLKLVSLFEEASAEQDENGVWQVTLTCTSSAMKYFFTDLEKVGYLRYALRFITGMSSRYTYLLFLHLESKRVHKQWETPLDELKAALNCADDDLYKEFKMFNQRILKRCQKEIHEKTDTRFTYEPIRKGRKVAAIRFTRETVAEKLAAELDGQLSMDDIPEPPEALSPAEQARWETLQLYRSVLPPGLTDDEILILEQMAEPLAPPSPHGREVAIADYFRLKALLFTRANKKQKIVHPFAWLQKSIQERYGEVL